MCNIQFADPSGSACPGKKIAASVASNGGRGRPATLGNPRPGQASSNDSSPPKPRTPNYPRPGQAGSNDAWAEP